MRDLIYFYIGMILFCLCSGCGNVPSEARLYRLIENKRYDTVISILSKKNIPADYDFAYLYRGIAWLQKKDYSRAETDFMQYLAFAQNYQGNYYLGLTMFNQRKYDASICRFHKALDCQKTTGAYLYIISAYLYLNEADNALKTSENALKRFPGDINLMAAHIRCLYSVNKQHDATRSLFEQWNENNMPPPVLAEYIWCKLLSHQVDNKTEKICDNLAKALPSPMTYELFALVMYEKGEYNTALENIKTAIELNGRKNDSVYAETLREMEKSIFERKAINYSFFSLRRDFLLKRCPALE